MSKRKTDIITEDVKLDNDKIKELKNNNEQFFIINGRRKTYHILTYGCQINKLQSKP